MRCREADTQGLYHVLRHLSAQQDTSLLCGLRPQQQKRLVVLRFYFFITPPFTCQMVLFSVKDVGKWVWSVVVRIA